MPRLYKVEFYVPVDHAEKVKEAVFAAGAGRYEAYDSCAWQTEGTGQFRPLEGSDPFIGEKGKVEHVREVKVECICREGDLKHVLRALVESHPYEEPAYGAFPLITLEDLT